MMFSDFSIITHGKWILAGEHAVIRGRKALVFPMKSKQLTLRFTPNNKKLSATFSGDCGDDMHLLFFSVIEHGFKLSGSTINHTQGHFDLINHIPIGAGLGASAALCVAVSKWFIHQNKVSASECLSFAKSLEDLFHSKSSGLDIIGSSSTNGVLFQQGEIITIEKTWQPRWYLSFSGHIGITSHCVKKVNVLWQEDTIKAQEIDNKMNASVEQAYEALSNDSSNREHELALSINQAAECFEDWGLTNSMLSKHMDKLKRLGALATKPTGSGSGGHVLSLWNTPPPQALIPLLIPA